MKAGDGGTKTASVDLVLVLIKEVGTNLFGSISTVEEVSITVAVVSVSVLVSSFVMTSIAVSYTHLTLPTIYSV